MTRASPASTFSSCYIIILRSSSYSSKKKKRRNCYLGSSFTAAASPLLQNQHLGRCYRTSNDIYQVPKGNPYHSATSGEMAIYRANSLILRKAGVQIPDPVVQVFNGQEVEVWPRITWKPKWALIFSDVKTKVNSGCSISQQSSMIINGKNVFLQDLSLDGALVINSVDEAEVKVSGCVRNKGWILEPVDYKDSSLSEEVRIRGFKIEKVDQLEMNYAEQGKFGF